MTDNYYITDYAQLRTPSRTYSIFTARWSGEHPRLVDKAIKDGMPGIAVTDHGNMFGIKEFELCKEEEWSEERYS